MLNFSIQFTYPLLLLLIIPIVGIALILHFRINKRFRRNRNRIVSLVLHCITGVLCVTVLSGMHFDYQIPNDTNEILFVVDVSDSQSEYDVAEERDMFLSDALTLGRYDGFKIGVVTFGFDQQYAVPLTTDVDSIYGQYFSAALPDVTGTDIAAALTFAADQFENPLTGKIVLITDGKETDEEAMSVIRSISAQGISVDTVHIADSSQSDDCYVVDVSYPDYHISPNEAFDISYEVRSTTPARAVMRIYDNGELAVSQEIDLIDGVQTYETEHTFATEGLHELSFEIEASIDGCEENNIFYSYYYLENFNKVLIIEDTSVSGNDAQSDKLMQILEGAEYEVDVLDFAYPQMDIPTETKTLCDYDQIVLNNINEYDMPTGFIDILYSYVYDYGGGLLTVGGDDDEGNAHAYSRSQMLGTKLQQMMPVEAINYTPPIAVMIIVDTSGSMGGELSDGSMLAAARSGAYACLDALDYRDYFGVMTLDTSYSMILSLTSRTEDAAIRRAISNINTTGGSTVYPEAIRRAGIALRAQENVARRHIIVISDGQVPQDQEEEYLEYISSFHEEFGLTLSFVGIGVAADSETANRMEEMCEAAGGEEKGSNVHTASDAGELVNEIQKDLTSPEINAVNDEEFNPIATQKDSPLFDDITFVKEPVLDDNGNQTGSYTETNSVDAVLLGFYGGRVRDNDYLVLSGEYDVPLYAQWMFGKGRVGSFMCDLGGGKWSSQFMSSANGQQFILNMITGIMPVTDIQIPDFEVRLETDNYINKLSVFADLEDGQTVKGSIVSTDGGVSMSLNTKTEEINSASEVYVSTALEASNYFSRSTFVIKRGGIYTLTLEVCDENNNVVSSYHTYISFSYSDEYDAALEREVTPDELMTLLAVNGSGEVIPIDDPSGIYADFVTAIDMTYDPRLVLLIVAIILFLLDVAVRKFKFKWPHEIIRDRKMQRMQQDNRDN